MNFQCVQLLWQNPLHTWWPQGDHQVQEVEIPEVSMDEFEPRLDSSSGSAFHSALGVFQGNFLP
jgi:hypothetical protein